MKPLFVAVAKRVPDLQWTLARIDSSISMWARLKAEATASRRVSVSSSQAEERETRRAARLSVAPAQARRLPAARPCHKL